MKITFKVKAKKKEVFKNRKVTIRFQNGFDADDKAIDWTKNTEVLVDSRRWDAKIQRVKIINSKDPEEVQEVNEKNDRLDMISRGINKKYEQDLYENIRINKEWFLSAVKAASNMQSQETRDKAIYFVDFARDFLENDYILKGSKKSSLVVKDSAIVSIERFNKYYKKRLLLTDFNEEFFRKWSYFETSRDMQSKAPKTALNYLTAIKFFLLRARGKGLKVNPFLDDKSFTIVIEKDDFPKVTFSDEQYEALLLKKELPHNLKSTRDWIVLNSEMGLRRSDCLKLIEKTLTRTLHGEYVSELRMQKTGKKISVMLHSRAKEILEQNGGELPKLARDVKTLNKNIRKLSRLMGFNELYEGRISEPYFNPITQKKSHRQSLVSEFPFHKLVTSHSIRRSFVTNASKNGLSSDEIATIMGYSSTSMVKHYNQEPPKPNHLKMKEVLQAQRNRTIDEQSTDTEIQAQAN